MLYSVSALGAVPQDQKLYLRDILGESSVSCARKRTLFHSMEDCRNAMLFMMKQ